MQCNYSNPRASPGGNTRRAEVRFAPSQAAHFQPNAIESDEEQGCDLCAQLPINTGVCWNAKFQRAGARGSARMRGAERSGAELSRAELSSALRFGAWGSTGPAAGSSPLLLLCCLLIKCHSSGKVTQQKSENERNSLGTPSLLWMHMSSHMQELILQGVLHTGEASSSSWIAANQFRTHSFEFQIWGWLYSSPLIFQYSLIFS